MASVLNLTYEMYNYILIYVPNTYGYGTLVLAVRIAGDKAAFYGCNFHLSYQENNTR